MGGMGGVAAAESEALPGHLPRLQAELVADALEEGVQSSQAQMRPLSAGGGEEEGEPRAALLRLGSWVSSLRARERGRASGGRKEAATAGSLRQAMARTRAYRSGQRLSTTPHRVTAKKSGALEWGAGACTNLRCRDRHAAGRGATTTTTTTTTFNTTTMTPSASASELWSW